MVTLAATLDLEICPHCSVRNPTFLPVSGMFETDNNVGRAHRRWNVYYCRRCGGCVTAGQRVTDSKPEHQDVTEIYPASFSVNEDIPSLPRSYLAQAHETLHAPDAASVMAASAVDAMLKERGLEEGSLYNRIDEAVAGNLITSDMGEWAHHVRLEANDPRHADKKRPNLTPQEGEQCVAFATALADLLFVLPARVTRGIEGAVPCEPEAEGDEG